MTTPTTGMLTLAERKKFVQIKIVNASQEPFHLYLRKTGVFIRSFKEKLELEAFLSNMAESRLTSVPRTTRST